MVDSYEEYRWFAERLAREAGGLLMEAFGKVKAKEKGPADLVTEADFASQERIAQRIRETYPGHTLLAEEEGADTDFNNPWRWVVDPLDGTMNFAHGFPCWVVSIGLEHSGNLVAGVVHVPLTGQTYSASLGNGATLDGERIRVSPVDQLRTSLITTGLPTNFEADADRQTAYMRRFSTRTHSLRRTGSSAWNLALLASGACEVCYATVMHPWDAAAGVLLIQEAGGVVSRLDGEPYDLYGLEILASNGRVHQEAVSALSEAWPERGRATGHAGERT
ncbi:MAG: inositol monophosphatase [Isosphaeraceae bacterium]